MKIFASCSAVLCLGTFAFAGHHAPLPPQLMSAKTVYIENNTGQASFADKCYDELTKWGRFKIVADPKQADLIFQIGARVRTYGYSGSSHTNMDCDPDATNCSGNTDSTLTQNSVGFTTVSVLDPTGQVLWSDTRRWGNLFTGFRSATRSVVKELRSRIEEQERLARK